MGYDVAKNRTDTDLSLYLGTQSQLTGTLSFSGNARLDGTFSGKILGHGSLLIGPQALIKAEINARSIIISGDVIGDVVATERIELKTPGKLKGNISAPMVIMDEGVLFEGYCAMAPVDSNKTVTLLASNK